MAEEIRHYSKMSIFLILFGVSSSPVSIDYKCKKCNTVFETLTKEEITSA